MWVVTAPFDVTLPDKIVNHGDDVAKDKVLKCGRTYKFGRDGHNNDINIVHKTVSKNVGSFIVGGWTADDVTDPASIPTLELILHGKKPCNIDKPHSAGITVQPDERVPLEDGCEIWVTGKIAITVRWRPVVCYETTGRVNEPISFEGCASLGIHVVQSHHSSITHHLAPSYSLTPILASSLLLAAHIVKPTWLREVLRLGSLPADDESSLEYTWALPSESDYRPGFATGLRDALKDPKTWTPAAGRVNLFKDRRFIFLTAAPGKAPPSEYVQVVERGVGAYEACAASGGVSRVRKVLMKGIAWAQERNGALSVVADNDALEAALGAEKWEELIQAAADLDLKFILPENILQAVAYTDLFYVESNSAQSGAGSALPDVVQNTHPNEPTYATPTAPAKRSVAAEDDEDDEMPPPPKRPTRRATRATSRQPSEAPESATPVQSTGTAQTAPTPRRMQPPRRGARKINVGFDEEDDSVVIEPPPRTTRSRAGSEQPTGPSGTQASLVRPRSRRQASLDRVLGLEEDDNPSGAASSKAATQLSRYRGLFEASEGASQVNGDEAGGPSSGLGGLGAVPEEEEESTASFLARQGGGPMFGMKRKADAMDLDEEAMREIEDDPDAMLPESQTQVMSTQSQRKRRAVEGLNAVEPSGPMETQTQVPPAQTQAPKSQTQAQTYTKPPSTVDGTQAKPKSSAEHKPDTDQQFLKALNSTKKGKKKEDEFDRDFNKLRISKPSEPVLSERKEEWDVLADFGDDSVRGNFMVVVDFDVDMETRKSGRVVEKEMDPRWAGRRDFKKFVKKGETSTARRRAKPVELVMSEEQDYGADVWPQKEASVGDITLDTPSQTAPPSRSRTKPPVKSQTRGRGRFAAADSEEDSDSPPPVPTRKPSSRTQTQTNTQRSKAKQKTPLFDIGSEEEDEMAADPDAAMDDEEDEVSTLRDPSPPPARGAKRKAAPAPVDDDDSDEATFKGFRKGRAKKGRFR